MMRNHISQPCKRTRRRGAAAVEMAVASPLLALLLMGTMDLGQFINVAELVSNSSRIGARKAAHNDTKSVDSVETAVINHFDNHFGTVARATLQEATTVTVTNAGGTTISGTTLGNIPSRQDLLVTVTFDYSKIRWNTMLSLLNNKPVSYTTTMRRL